MKKCMDFKNLNQNNFALYLLFIHLQERNEGKRGRKGEKERENHLLVYSKNAYHSQFWTWPKPYIGAPSRSLMLMARTQLLKPTAAFQICLTV